MNIAQMLGVIADKQADKREKDGRVYRRTSENVRHADARDQYKKLLTNKWLIPTEIADKLRFTRDGVRASLNRWLKEGVVRRKEVCFYGKRKAFAYTWVDQ
jgi:predicted transcriptional regulator